MKGLLERKAGCLWSTTNRSRERKYLGQSSMWPRRRLLSGIPVNVVGQFNLLGSVWILQPGIGIDDGRKINHQARDLEPKEIFQSSPLVSGWASLISVSLPGCLCLTTGWFWNSDPRKLLPSPQKSGTCHRIRWAENHDQSNPTHPLGFRNDIVLTSNDEWFWRIKLVFYLSFWPFIRLFSKQELIQSLWIYCLNITR